MNFDLQQELNKKFPPLDIENATEKEILRYRMLGLSSDEERRVIKRAIELGMLPKDKE